MANEGTLEEKIMGLQKFKESLSSTVISNDNASLASMGTDQLLDLFDVGPSDSGEEAKAEPDKPMTMEQAMAAGDLWDEEQYESEFNMDSFMAAVKK